jgi:uncharacterized protein YqgC (DUF456 family)
MDIALIILGTFCIIIGFLGCVLPVLPGVTLSYVGILLLHFTSKMDFSNTVLVSWAVVVVVVQVLDYLVPVWGAKLFGGSRKGAWGSAIGVVAGLFVLPPFGIILCPFVGAVIGELIEGKEMSPALKAGFGSFLGFLAGTVMKLIISGVLAFVFFRETAKIVWHYFQ